MQIKKTETKPEERLIHVVLVSTALELALIMSEVVGLHVVLVLTALELALIPSEVV
jgi:hypothetical protein